MQEAARKFFRIELENRRREDHFKALPTIESRKHSLNLNEEEKHHARFTKFSQNEEVTLPSSMPSKSEQPTHQSIFTMPKNFSLFKKRMLATPHRFSSKQHIPEILECNLMKKQIETLNDIQRCPPSREQILFNAAFGQFGLIQRHPLNATLKPTTQMRHTHKKKSIQKAQESLISISSKSDKKSLKTLQFFNVQKMNLHNSDKIKKSTSLFLKIDDTGLIYTNEATQNCRLKDLEERMIYKKEVFLLDLSSKGETESCTNHHTEMATISSKDEDNLRVTELPKPQTDLREKTVIKGDNILLTLRRKQTMRLPIQKQKPIEKQQRGKSYKMVKKFNAPFETYFYRDFIWKANFSNQRVVEIPLEYERKFKVYVGKGNNSCMVIGLISRRPWLSITDKLDEANFVWTQLKQLSYFKKQQTFKGTIGLQQLGLDKYQNQSILTQTDSRSFDNYFAKYFNLQQRIDEKFTCRSKYFRPKKMIKLAEIQKTRMQNHLINNYVLGNKKALFTTMQNYYKEMKLDVFHFLPLTFHIKDGQEDPKYFEFLKYYHRRAKEVAINNELKGRVKEYNAWIVKPGENSNRGQGIKMCLNLQQIKSILKKRQRYGDGSYRTFIVQAYIQRPLLYYKRKFDLRHYIMMTSINGIIKGYWYRDGYVRTTSSEYSLASNQGSIHLTNDAVQKNLADYGKYEKGNKISYEELSTYIDKFYHEKGKSFEKYIYPKMKRIATDAMRACSASIDPTKLQNNFEVFGMDFMIDANLEVWLIEINTNPCLELSCPLLGCIISKMVQNALELTLDAMIPPPVKFSSKGMHFYKDLQKENKFELVFDERIEQPFDGSLQVLDQKLLEEEDDTFEDCGENWQDEK